MGSSSKRGAGGARTRVRITSSSKRGARGASINKKATNLLRSLKSIVRTALTQRNPAYVYVSVSVIDGIASPAVLFQDLLTCCMGRWSKQFSHRFYMVHIKCKLLYLSSSTRPVLGIGQVLVDAFAPANPCLSITLPPLAL